MTPAAAAAQNTPADRIDAIEKQIRNLQGELQSLKKELGEAKTYNLSDTVKVFRMVKKEKQEVEGGLKSSSFKDIDAKKGIPATLVTDNDNKVVEIRLGGKKPNK